MRAYVVPKSCKAIDEVRQVERPDPQPSAGQVLIRVRATSLNYRDQMIVAGRYFGGPVTRDLIPLSDGAGEVIAVGAGVTRFKTGDRVAGTFFQTAPPTALGSPLDGMLAEQVVLSEDGVVAVPQSLTLEEAACLPCAGVTAWRALMHAGRPTRAGDIVLVLGSGGVATLALQLARAAGACVIATSSSDEKGERLRSIGAAHCINYTRTPEWDQEVMRLTGGRGVDGVIEIGGAGTLARSMRSLARGGKIALIGFLAGMTGDTNPSALMMTGGSIHGVFVGDRAMFEELTRAIDANRIKPVIEKIYPFEEAIAALQHQASGQFVGKLVISLP